jgi:hypothetical protein
MLSEIQNEYAVSKLIPESIQLRLPTIPAQGLPSFSIGELNSEEIRQLSCYKSEDFQKLEATRTMRQKERNQAFKEASSARNL